MKALSYSALFISLAFIHPTSFVISQWLEQVKPVKTIHIKQQTTLFDSSLPNGTTVVDEEIWVKKPSTFRKSSKYPKGRIDWVSLPNKTVRISSGEIETITPIEAYGAVGVFYLPDGFKRLIQSFQQLGVTTESTSWTLRDKTQALYQLGSAPGPMAFFMKDEWTPAGVVFKNKEYRLETHKPGKFSIPFPETMEIRMQDKPLETTTVLFVTTNSPISDSIFDINLLRSTSVPK